MQDCPEINVTEHSHPVSDHNRNDRSKYPTNIRRCFGTQECITEIIHGDNVFILLSSIVPIYCSMYTLHAYKVLGHVLHTLCGHIFKSVIFVSENQNLYQFCAHAFYIYKQVKFYHIWTQCQNDQIYIVNSHYKQF